MVLLLCHKRDRLRKNCRVGWKKKQQQHVNTAANNNFCLRAVNSDYCFAAADSYGAVDSDASCHIMMVFVNLNRSVRKAIAFTDNDTIILS